MKTFTTLQGMGRDDLMGLVDSAMSFRDRKTIGHELSSRSVAMLFFERSTRTRLSFELAANRLGAHIMSLDPSRASTGKGESLRDTALTVSAIGADMFVVRHSEAGVPDLIAEWTGAPVVNAGDGTREHPTQGLVDAVTLVRHFGGTEGLRMAIVGDIKHSRVAGSLLHAMPVLGVDLTLIGPSHFLPETLSGVETSTEFDDVLPELDVVYLLRVQTERGVALAEDYAERFGLDGKRASALRETAVVMHPGPLNRGVEITDEVADSPRSLVLDQVSNGVPARMAVLAALEGALT